MVSGTDDKENLVAPRQPIQQPSERAHCLLEGSIPYADGQVDDCGVGCCRRFIALAIEQTTHSPMQQVHDEGRLRNGLFRVPPAPWIGQQDRTNIEDARQWRIIRPQVAMDDERRH